MTTRSPIQKFREPEEAMEACEKYTGSQLFAGEDAQGPYFAIGRNMGYKGEPIYSFLRVTGLMVCGGKTEVV